MPASYPGTIVTFTTKTNVTDTVDASHPNQIQEEIRALQLTLGINPHLSAYRGINYVDVKARLEDIESDFSLTTHNHAHAGLTGLTTGDDHPQYLNTTRHDVAARHTYGAALGTPGVATTAAVGDSPAAGTGVAPAREDHRHGQPTFGAAPPVITPNSVSAAGTATTLARSDHQHGLATGAPGASAVGDTAAEGGAATVARADHRHAREAFSATAPTAATPGGAAAVGTSVSPARSDHTHSMAGFAAPGTSLPGNTVLEGTATTFARSDHRHAREAYASTVSSMQTYGQAPAVGTAAEVARADHNHGTPAADVRGPTGVIVAYGGTAAPTGWLLCDGVAHSRTTYADLYGVIGTRYGAGDGTNTFNVPDMRDRLPIGQATPTSAVVTGNVGGHTHTGTTGAGSSHAHGASSAAGASHTHSLSIPANTSGSSGHNHGGWTGTENNNHTHGVNGTTGGQSRDHTHIVENTWRHNSGGSSMDHEHGVSIGTGTVSSFHQHYITTDGESGHTHGIGAGSIGGEAGHTHGITVNAEASHTHGFTTGSTANVPTQSVNYIIKT